MNLVQMGIAAAKGAAAGSVLPGVGSALGAAGGVALDLAPELGSWLFGPSADDTVKAVQGAIETVTGTSDSEAQLASLADPQVASQLRVQLAAIAAQRSADEGRSAQDRLTSQLSDVANARNTTIQMVNSGSSMAWGAAVVSVVVLLTFGCVMMLTLYHALPETAAPVLNVLLGTLSAMATSVVSYWVGSSVGSAKKDDRLDALLKQRSTT